MGEGVLRLLAGVIAALVLAGVASASSRPKWMDRFAYAVAMCETQANWKHRAGSYEGGFGWYSGTWDLDKPRGYPDHAYQASARQQYRVFKIGRARGRYWGCIAHGGYRSHL